MTKTYECSVCGQVWIINMADLEEGQKPTCYDCGREFKKNDEAK